MIRFQRPLSVSHRFLVALAGGLALACGPMRVSVRAQEAPQNEPVPPAQPEAVSAPEDAELPAWRRGLLETASRAASSVPEKPHHKTRGKLQDAVMMACFELDQPELALEYARGILDWRRGCGFAEYARYCQAHGHPALIESFLAEAEDIARALNEAGDQAWRRDRILVKVALCRIEMGFPLEAREIEANVEPSESLPLFLAKARLLPAGELQAWLQEARLTATSGGFEGRQSVLQAGGELVRRFYADEAQRKALEEVVRLATNQMPLPIVVEALCALSSAALEAGDLEGAKRYATEAVDACLLSTVTADLKGPCLGRAIEALAQAGGAEAAKEGLEAGLAVYEKERDRLMGIDRADALRGLAQACESLGDRSQATLLYWRVIEEGAENPNARPRAEDLVETLLSMAQVGFEPEPKLIERIEEITAGLRDPW
jgi:hypothetical protein